MSAASPRAAYATISNSHTGLSTQFLPGQMRGDFRIRLRELVGKEDALRLFEQSDNADRLRLTSCVTRSGSARLNSVA
jgi:hypothetical protein